MFQAEEISMNQTESGNTVPVDNRLAGVLGKSSQSFNFVGDYEV